MVFEKLLLPLANLTRADLDRIVEIVPAGAANIQDIYLEDNAHEAFFSQMLGTVAEPTAPFGLMNGQHDRSKLTRANMPLDGTLSLRLRDRASKMSVSVASLCHLAWAKVLSRLTGREEVVFGTVLFGRMQEVEGCEHAIGMFINTLPVRIKVGDEPVDKAVCDTHALLGRLFLHKHASLSLARRCSAIEPPVPLFTSLLTYRHIQDGNASQCGTLTWEGMQVLCCEQSGNCPLNLAVDDSGQGVSLTVHAQEPIDPLRLCGYMHNALMHLTDALERMPQTAVRSIEVIPEAERRQILFDWNATQIDYPKDKCIHELFEEQAQKRPDAVAIEFEGKQLSYRELNERSNQLARCLRKRGVGRGSIVAVMMNRSVEMIISLLGILKAGGTYLPIDAHNPENRIFSLLDDSQTALLLTETPLVGKMSFTKLKNLHDMGQYAIITKKREPIADLDALPFPDRTLVNYHRYDNYIGEGCVKNSISIMASRGCPYRCLYCFKIWPKKQVARSALNIFQELLHHYERGYRTFSILDDIFNLNRKNSEAFFNLIIKNNLNIRLLFPSGLRSDLLTPDYIDLMAEAGVVQTALALETASARLQKMLRKNLDIDKLCENLFYICNNHPGIIIDLFTMFGFPTETEKEAMMTLDFIKSIEWLHFPMLHALKIYPGTEMFHFAIQHGVTKEAIERASDQAFHDLGETLPFSMAFAREYKANFLGNYFLNRKRLEYVIPLQKRVLTYEEITAKYNSYLPGGLANYPEVAALIGDKGFFSDNTSIAQAHGVRAPSISVKGAAGGEALPGKSRLRILLLDLSEHFSDDFHMLDDMIEAPLGLMYLLTYLNQQFGNKIHGKIVKSKIDFDSLEQLHALLDDFGPQVIGVRTLSHYKDFFHKTVSSIKQWFRNVPIIAGGPYASSESATMLSDGDIDVLVHGEGEVTLGELIGKIIEAGGRLPGDKVLNGISGIRFIPRHGEKANEARSGTRQILCLDEITAEMALEDNKNLAKVNDTGDLAYVIYTSGSTGKPKGVMVEHRNLLNLIYWHCHAFLLKENDSSSCLAGLGFDASAWEIWPPLCAGARLLPAPEAVVQDPATLLKWWQDRSLDVSFLPTPIAELAFASGIDHAKLRHLLIGGDRLHCLPAPSSFNLVNNYGPTEATVVATSGKLEACHRVLHIGRPIANNRVYILDHSYQPVPMGVTGELYIGGAGVARGYLDRPELTAERFLPDPFVQATARESDPRMYKTGDLGRFLPDGNVEFLGRNDFQVKIRGCRIELGEIESRLAAIDGVREAAVIAREDTPGSKRLVAYYTGSCELCAEALRTHACAVLPGYMVPVAYVRLKALPLTVNGKLDRKALPAPEGDAFSTGAYEPPKGEVEKRLAEIWAELLHIEKIGRRDQFFELGGHSILTIQMLNRLNQAGLGIKAADLFSHPTIERLAAHIEGEESAAWR